MACCGQHELAVGEGCCNGEVYITSTHGCCNDKEIYLLATHCCCNGIVKLKKDFEDEKAKIIREAKKWNKTSPTWSWGNQCEEQALALTKHLSSSLWNFSVIGGYWGIKTTIGGMELGYAFQHNVAKVSPICDECASPFILDAYKGKLTYGRKPDAATDVKEMTEEEFRKKYPKPL